jgi:transcriptional regulator with XRE-family HTH domain
MILRTRSTLRVVRATARGHTAIDETTLAGQIGGRLREARLDAGLTQQQLAEGRYTKAYVSALENGLAKPSMAALTFLAERLGVPAARFIGDGPVSWTRLEADLALAAGHWVKAADAYRGLLDEASGPARRAELLRGLAEALVRLDRGGEAAASAAEAAQLFTNLGRETDAALARYWLSAGEYQQGNTVEAAAILRSVLERTRSGLRVEPDFELRLLMALSSNASREGQHGVALAYLEEIRGLADQLDDRRRAVYLFDLAYSYRETGDHEGAIRAGIASLALFRATDSEFEVGALENDLALSYLALGNTDRAEEMATSSCTRFQRLADDRWLAHVFDTQARIAFARGAREDSLRLARRALELAERTSNHKARLDALLAIARAEAAGGHGPEAMAWYERAAEAARGGGSSAVLREALGEWADLLAKNGEHQKAFELLREAVSR